MFMQECTLNTKLSTRLEYKQQLPLQEKKSHPANGAENLNASQGQEFHELSPLEETMPQENSLSTLKHL